VTTTPDVFLEEAIAAARRGVKVRILLSNAFLDPTDPKDNTFTVAYVNDLARREGLDMEARLFDNQRAQLDKIHNKGVVVDNRRALVTSVNWSFNSPANNREVGLLLDHPAIGQYFADIFTYDWYNGAAADYPLITEVDAGVGFLEISTFGTTPVDLAGWTLSTGTTEWTLPAGASAGPGQPLVVAQDSRTFRTAFGNVANVVEIPGLAFSTARDTLRLKKAQTLVDSLAWGGAQPGWNLPGPAPSALCRPVAGKDTNTYLDWTLASRGTPGVAGCQR